jgi:curved DNA-binding protein CbpA
MEQALERAESSLEELIQSSPAQPAEVPVEALVEAIIEPDAGDNAGNSAQTAASATAQEWEEGDDVGDDQTEAGKQRRQRLLRRAMENLGAFQPRPQPQGAVIENPAPAQAPAAAAPASPAPALKADDAELAAQIEARYAEVQAKKDHFVMLGLSRESGAAQVKTAFLSLAKVYHPDRLPASLIHLSAKGTAVFEAIREAYDTLYDDARRASYVQNLGKASASRQAGGGGKQDKATEAADLARKAEVFFRKRDFRAAEEHYQHAYQVDPKAVHLASAAWALYMDPARKGEAAKSRQMMADALKLDPSCDRAHYQLGVISRVEGDMDRAERHFREAVRVNPRHLEANQELRLIEMRKKKEKKGFFR